MASERDPLFDDDEQREADAEKARDSARPYSIAVGVLFLGFIMFAGINSLSNDSPGPVGLAEGKRLPPFAAPSATGSLDGDSNVDQKKACQIHVRDAIRICDYFDRPARAGRVVQQVRRSLRPDARHGGAHPPSLPAA